MSCEKPSCGLKVVAFTFSFQLFGISEDEAIQEPDEGEVLQGVPCVLNGFSLQEQTHKILEKDTFDRKQHKKISTEILFVRKVLPEGWWLQTKKPRDGNAEQAAERQIILKRFF